MAVTVLLLPGLLWLAVKPEIPLQLASSLNLDEEVLNSDEEPAVYHGLIPATTVGNGADRGDSDSEFLQRFAQAQEFITQGHNQAAIDSLGVLINERPSQAELYLNLAALYAGNGQLELARVTLMRGLKADRKYASLFAGLQKIHGVLAANAYKAAMDEKGGVISRLELPLIDITELEPLQEPTAEQPDIGELPANADRFDSDEASASTHSQAPTTTLQSTEDQLSSRSAEQAEVKTISDEIQQLSGAALSDSSPESADDETDL